MRVIVIRNKEKGMDIEYISGSFCHKWKIRPNSCFLDEPEQSSTIWGLLAHCLGLHFAL